MSTLILIMLSVGTVIHLLLIGYFAVGQIRAFRRFEDGSSQSLSEYKKISLIIPLRNEEQNIASLIESLGQLNYSPEYVEVILVDDQSEDNTRQLLNWHAEKLPMSVKLIRSDRRQGWSPKKRALHMGIEAATHEIIVISDADITFPKEWLQTVNYMFQQYDADMIPGIVLPDYYTRETPLTRVQALDFCGLVAMGVGAYGNRSPFLCNAANLAFKKAAYCEINGFEGYENILSGDDVFLLQKMKAAGKKIVWNLVPHSAVKTMMKPNFSAFIRQRIRWASKNHRYDSPLRVIVLALEVLYFPVILLSLFFVPATVIIPLMAIKMLVDMFLLKPFLDRFDPGGNLLRSIVAAELFQILYIPVVLVGMLSNNGDWK